MLNIFNNRILLLVIFFVLHPFKITAQVIPDNTLGTESSKINSIDELRDAIEGGAIRGDNLFHSFSEFSISEGNTVNFVNPSGIKNIFSRITGSNISKIFGELGIGGDANLFFINPNGIVFGKNAVINIGGSFLATTAETIDFNDSSEYSAVNPNKLPLLTIAFPVGLGFGSNSQATNVSGSGLIKINGTGHSLNALGGRSATREQTNNNLTTAPSKSLVLLGSEINFEGGVLVSPSGNIEIGSVQEGKVEITDFNQNQGSFSLKYDKVETLGDIVFAKRSLIDVSSVPSDPLLSGGTITVQGKSIKLENGSVILNQNFGENNSGSINIFADNSFQISGTDPVARILGGIRTEALSKGKGADIKIFTPQLSITNGGVVQALTYSSFLETVSGDINLNVSDLLVSGSSPLSAISISNVATFTFDLSQAGNLSIDSNTVVLQNGGALSSSGTLGSVGEISINATEYVQISGFEPTFSLPSSISSTNSFSPIPGKVSITAPNIYLQDGGNINTSSFATGSSGSIAINVDNLEIRGKVPPSTFNSGTPSNISSSTLTFDSDLVEALPETIDSSLFADLPLQGNSGNIEIYANSITIDDSGFISALNTGTGNGGELNINANSIFLENGGGISASTLSGQGGNITLNTNNLQLLDQSQITASAGGSGDGGNIIIDSDTILGVKNSDITANAVGGDGGNIIVNSDFIVGLEERSRLTPFNDITATSEFGIDGTVTINTPDNNLEEQVFAAFKNYTTPEKPELLKRRCLNPRNPKQKIINIGRAGIPANPDNFFDDEEAVRIERVGESNQVDDEPVDWIEGDPIVEPNAVKVGADGETYLVSETLVSQTPLEDAESGICTRFKAKNDD